MSIDANILENHPFFEGINSDCLDKLAETAKVIKYKDGDLVTREGKSANKVYIILKGKVNILTPEIEGYGFDVPALTPIQTLNPGEIVGLSWMLEPYEWKFDTKCIGATELIQLDAEYLRQLCERDAILGYEILKRVANLMGDRLFATRYELANHSGKPFSQVEGG